MRFLCKYTPNETGATYYRRVSADCINEASVKAHRFAKVGFRLVSVIQEIGKD